MKKVLNKEKSDQNKIKAIIFDLGGILVNESMEDHRNLLCKKVNIDPKKFYKAIKKYSYKASVGELSAHKYPYLVAKELGIDPTKFYKIWLQIRDDLFGFNRQTERLIKHLKKDYIVGTLTNITKTNDQIRLKYDAYKHFSIKIISNKVGLKKPDQRIYSFLIKKLNFDSSQIIFIDDRQEFIVPAKKLGMKTILFKNNKQLVKDLKKMGVKLK